MSELEETLACWSGPVEWNRKAGALFAQPPARPDLDWRSDMADPNAAPFPRDSRGRRLSVPLRVRLFSRVAVRGADECWPWLGPVDAKGYGRISLGGARSPGRPSGDRVHRVSYVLANGPIAPGVLVCHRCDNPPCVNPDHLFLGTAADNNADRDGKGRHVALHGSRHGSAKLTEDAVREMRRLHSAGVSCQALAARFGVDRTNVWLIVRHKAWRHVA
jgi:hypothetical protein